MSVSAKSGCSLAEAHALMSVGYFVALTDSCRIQTLDRTQWKNNNVLVIAVIYKKRAIPIYWKILNKKGSTNLREQQAIIRPVLRLFKNYELVFLGDREFHGVELSYWLKTKKSPQKIYFIFRQKQGTYFKKHKGKYQKLSDLGITPGTKAWDIFMSLVDTTRKLGISFFEYMRSRISQTQTIPPLATIIREKSSLNPLGWSW